jgi:DNA-binding NtrC family response regulator
VGQPGTSFGFNQSLADTDLNLANNERRLIESALQQAGGNKSQAARLLGITRRTLYSRLKLLGISSAADADGSG